VLLESTAGSPPESVGLFVNGSVTLGRSPSVRTVAPPSFDMEKPVNPAGPMLSSARSPLKSLYPPTTVFVAGFTATDSSFCGRGELSRLKTIVGSETTEAEKATLGPPTVEVIDGICWIRLRYVETVPETGAL